LSFPNSYDISHGSKIFVKQDMLNTELVQAKGKAKEKLVDFRTKLIKAVDYLNKGDTSFF
jgi:hypothetical protein